MFFECFTSQKPNELMQKQLLSSLIGRDTGSGSVVIFVELKLIRTERSRDELALF